MHRAEKFYCHSINFHLLIFHLYLLLAIAKIASKQSNVPFSHIDSLPSTHCTSFYTYLAIGSCLMTFFFLFLSCLYISHEGSGEEFNFVIRVSEVLQYSHSGFIFLHLHLHLFLLSTAF